MIKDWRIKSDYTYIRRYVNKRTAEELIVEKQPVNLGWSVWSWKLPVKRFPDKNHALAYAIDYMKKH